MAVSEADRIQGRTFSRRHAQAYAPSGEGGGLNISWRFVILKWVVRIYTENREMKRTLNHAGGGSSQKQFQFLSRQERSVESETTTYIDHVSYIY